MKRIISGFLVVAILVSAIPLSTLASTPVGGTVLAGEYVAVVNTNTDPEKAQSTGAIVFDSSAAAGSSKTVLNGEMPYNDIVAGGTQGRARAAKAVVGGYTKGQENYFYNGTYVCIYTGGKKSFIWMEKKLKAEYDAAGISIDAVGKEISDMYDGRPYKVLTELAGSEAALENIMEDSTGKLSILVERTNGSSGYYAGEQGITAIHINMIEPAKYFSGAYNKYDGLIVHETQHAMFRHLACNGDKGLAYKLSWINEGLAVAAMDYFWGGDDPTNWLSLINNRLAVRTGSALMYSAYRQSSAQDYSMPYLFIRYLASQKAKSYNPALMIKSFYNNKMTAATTPEDYVNSVLLAAGLKGSAGGALQFKEALANFYVAAVAQESTGAFGFYDDPIVRKSVNEYPIFAGSSGSAINLSGSAGIIIKTINGKFTVPSGAGADIKFIAFNKNSQPKKPTGSGTSAQPFQIKTAEDMAYINSNPSANYKLINDVDMASGGGYFYPLTFSGVLDGNGKTLKNLSKPIVNTNKGIIRDLTVNGFSGEFSSWTGIISNFNEGIITDCRATGEVNVRLTSTKMFNLPVFGTMTAQNDMSGIVKNCYSDAVIKLDMPANTDYAGALVGLNKYVISNCYSKGSLTINNLSSAGTITAGGIVGDQYSTMSPKPSIENCYSTTAVSIAGGTKDVSGRIAGSIDAQTSIKGCYGLEGMAAIGKGKTDTTASKTQIQMQNQATYEGWSFGSVWQMPSGGYPQFSSASSLVALPGVKEYYVGEELNVYGSTIKVNGASIALELDMISGFDSSTAGEKVVTVTYRGISTTFNITVKEPTNISFLEVYTKPRQEYFEGESFDPERSKLRATINGKANVYIQSGYTVNSAQPLTAGTTFVTYTYGGYKAQLPVTVKKKTPVKIVVTSGIKLNYDAGDKLDLSQLKVQLVYGDGSRSNPIGISQFAANNVHVSKGLTKEILNETVLTTTDHRVTLFAYVGSKTPDNDEIPFEEIGELSVIQSFFMEDEDFELTLGKEEYLSTKSMQGTTQNQVTAKKLEGSLPDGIKIIRTPSWQEDCFYFEGTPTKKDQETNLKYQFTDPVTGKTSTVNYKFKVVSPSSQCNLLSFTIMDVKNSANEYTGVIDHVNNTVNIAVPKDFESKNTLRVETRGSKGSTGAVTEMGKTLASIKREITITAETGVSKTYAINISTIENPVQLKAPIIKSFENGVAVWEKVENASSYIVVLNSGLNSTDPVVKSYQTVNGNELTYNFVSDITIRGDYTVRVAAVGEGNFLTSNKAVSPVYKYIGPTVTKIVLSPKSTQIKPGNSLQLVPTLTGLGEYSEKIIWSLINAKSSNTKIVEGKLTVGADEETQEITVRATSFQSPLVYGEAFVEVEQQARLSTPTNLRFEERKAAWLPVENAKGYKVALFKDKIQVGLWVDTTAAAIDFSAQIPKESVNEYFFKVYAYSSGYQNSETAQSEFFKGTPPKPITLEKIMVVTPPIKQEYISGNNFDSKGMVIKAYYSNNSSKNITGYTFSPKASLTTANTRVLISYTEGGITKTVYQSIKVGMPNLSKIVVEVAPKKVSYVSGQKFDKTGMAVKAYYVNGASKRVSTYSVVPNTALTTANTRVLISYKEGGITKTVYQSIKVVPKVVTRIVVAVPPTKTKYVVGQKFDKKGMVVKAYFNDNSSRATVTHAVSPMSALTVKNTSVKITLNSGGKTFVVYQKIKVYPLAITGIKVTAAPTKTKYVVGQTFNRAGMSVRAYYNNGTSKPVTAYTVWPTKALTTANKYVKITYGSGAAAKTTTYKIKVEPLAISKIKVVVPPKKTTYRQGEKFNKTGMLVRAYYNNGTSKVITKYKVEPITSLRRTHKYVVISYISGRVKKTTTVKVIVK